MRLIRKLMVLVVLWLALGATVVSAAEVQSPTVTGREVGGLARILGHFHAFFSAAWEEAAWEIDPFGRSSQGDSPDGPGTDEACDIDPFG